MRKVTKKLLALGFAAMLAISSSMTAFAEEEAPTPVPMECGMTVLGHKPIVADGSNDPNKIFYRNYQMIIPGITEISARDIVLEDGWTCYWSADDTIKLLNWETGEGDALNIYNYANDWKSTIWIWSVPAGTTAESLGDDARYFVNIENSGTQTTTADNGDWASNSTGWWIQYKDGSYLTNGWWQSPTSGLWYYMGADGYMVTDTVIDGCTINSDGVWVQ